MQADGIPKKRRVTLADIAKACGVSSMTVSLALRKNPKIPEKTRVRILKKAEELDYTPDPVLAALNQYRTHSQDKSVQATLAWINPFKDPKRQHLFTEFNLYWKGAFESAKQYGYRLEEFSTSEIALPRMNTIFKARNIKGLLAAPLPAPRFRDPNIDWHDFPWDDFATVRFGYSIAYPESHFIASAQARNTVMAFEHIRAKGYRRIGFVGLFNKRRVFCMGAHYAQLEWPEEEQVPSLLFSLDHSQEKRMENLDQWMKKNRPEAILTDIAELPQMLRELGCNVPSGIGIATTTIHDTAIDAGIDQNPEEIGRAAIRTLVSLINEQNYGIPSVRNQILIEGKWVDGSMLPDRRPLNEAASASL